MNKKIGIITFHRAANFGAMLQSFALKKSLQELGGDRTEIIDYRASSIEKLYKYHWDYCFKDITLSFRSIKNVVGRLGYISILKKRLQNFRKFEKKYLSPSPKPYTDYDVIVFGSDQIWNVGITQNDDIYFGYIGTDKVKKVAYAGSLGHGDIDAFKSKVRLLKTFSAIGVRELQLISVFLELGIDSFLCLDPTFLLTSDKWLKYLGLPQITKKREKILLVYCIRDKERVLKAARPIAAKLGLNLVILESSETIDVHGISKKATYYGPKEFVRCFNDADFVVTDSFHGTVFSILFHKTFVSCRLGDGRDGRAESLLSQIGLITRLQHPEEILSSSFTDIDFVLSDKKLNYLRDQSLRFLSEMVIN